MHYVHISTLYSRTTFMFICQTVNMIGFRKRCFVLVHSEVCCGSVRFFEYAANSAGGERLRREGRYISLARRNRWHYSTEWNQRFIQNVASCYVLCLTKESVITATLVHAPVCVCVCVCVRHAHRTEIWVTRVRLKCQVEAGPDWIPSRSGSGLESGLWEALP